MFFYAIPKADQALIISGGRGRGDGPSLRPIVGHGAFVMPVVRSRSFLSLATVESEVAEKCVSSQGIQLNVRAVMAFKVGGDNDSILAAAQRFLSDQSQMGVLVQRIFSGHLRSIVGAMTVEEIVNQRQKLSEEVLEGSKLDMARMGLVVDALQIQGIDDNNSGYIDAMSAPHRAAVQREAKIAQANAELAAAEAEQASRRAQAEFARKTAVANSSYQAEMDQAKAAADQAGPLAMAKAQIEVTNAQAALASQQAELREQQLVTEVIRPAEAEAQRIRILAQANADRTRIEAEAAASNNSIALDQLLIAQLPGIVESAGKALAGSNLTVLNGAEGVTDIVANLLGQGLSLYRGLSSEIKSADKKPSTEVRGTPSGNGRDPAKEITS